MTNPIIENPAEQAAVEALNKVFEAIKNTRNFRLEAGAGAGKTYSLIRALKYLIAEKGMDFMKAHKKIACITYTEVARDEIKARIDNNPVVLAETIHAFSWGLIKDFQKPIRALIPGLGEKWTERVKEVGGTGMRRVSYNLGYPKVTDHEIMLHHDDVIKLMVSLLEEPKFKNALTSRFPIIFIDEYQDTAKILADAFQSNFIETGTGPLIGLFGDHWQKIYGSASGGLISASPDKLEVIGKNANFRSERVIVDALNKMRPDLEQNVSDPSSNGEIIVFHSNTWSDGERLTANHWQGDLPTDVAHQYLELTKKHLEKTGWIFSREHTKILMLTHNVLAKEQGYPSMSAVFSDNEDYLKKSDTYISFLIDTVELGCQFFEKKQYGEMFKLFGRTPRIKKHSDKAVWNKDLNKLMEIRREGTIADIIEFLKITKKPRLSSKVEDREDKSIELSKIPEAERTEEDQRFITKLAAFKAIPFKEITALSKYIDDKTPFATKHGVKGAEFENVLVVCGRGWNHYNWSQMLEWVYLGVPKGKEETFERNRNLFYVAISRPQKRLALLFTQELSENAIATLNNWFGSSNVKPLEWNAHTPKEIGFSAN